MAGTFSRSIPTIDPLHPDPPKFTELVFVQLEIFGNPSGAAGAEEFLPSTQYGVKLFIPPMCVLKMLNLRWGFQE